ncbi:MAG: peptidylprolyl isomerase [Candidatus Zixiibacteriota bacterium]|nr:MAG: peptidylprolyl isomerase [candidate division Zixibacteria bacterium]
MRLLERTLLIAVISTMVAGSLFAQGEPVDQIAAVVGDEVILASELANQMQLAALQAGIRPKNQQELDALQRDILEQMISDRLFLLAARGDTSIIVRSEEIDAALDEQVARISQNYDTYDQFLAELAAEGLTVRELKKRFRQDVENQLLKQRYIQKKLSTVSVSRQEVREFYETFKDSIPDQPEAVKLAHILLTIQPSPEVEDSIQQYVTELRQRILDGADFAVISSQYSTGGAGANGGDLGYLSRADVVPEFARAAFNLSIGDISGVIRTQFGYHVIKCEGKRGDRLHLRHLLVEVPPSASDSLRTQQLADSLLTALRDGDDFEQMAKVFSADNDTRAHGGELGWFATAQLPPEFSQAVTGWATPGEYRGPVSSTYGLHVLKLLDYQAERSYTLKEDFDRLKELARQDKTGRLVDKWIEGFKEKTYISYRLQ